MPLPLMVDAKVVLITGAGGFIGANLCRRLLQENAEVHAILKGSTSRWRLEGISGRMHLHPADLTDAAAVGRIVAEVRPHAVYHLAAYGSYPAQTDVDSILRTNILGTWNLLHAAGREGCPLFVNTGSSSEYGRRRTAMRERDRLDPDSFYAVAKSAQSLLVRQFARQYDRAAVTFRVFSAYGPFEEPTRLIPRLMMSLLEERPIEMADPDTARDFIYIDDVVTAFRRIEPLAGLRGDILNLGTGTQTTLAAVVRALQTVSGRKLDARWNRMPARAWDKTSWVADITALRRATGWRPPTTLRAGLAASLDWFRENRGLYSGPRVGA